MKKQVKLLMDEDRQFYVVDAQGVEYELQVFDGGGYYTALWARTKKEIKESERKRDNARKEWEEHYRKTEKEQLTKKWYQFWK